MTALLVVMSLARAAVLGMTLVGYVVVLLGLVLDSLPVSTLLAHPPLASVGAATGAFFLLFLGLDRALPHR